MMILSDDEYDDEEYDEEDERKYRIHKPIRAGYTKQRKKETNNDRRKRVS